MIFKNKTAVVTGGANGIGLCITQEFRKLGAKTAVIDIDSKGCGCDLFYCGDIANESVLTAFAGEITAKFGKVDYLVNNACAGRGGVLSGCSYDEFIYVQKIGVAAPYMLTKLLLPYFGENAAVVNISSTRAFMSQPDTESYTAAKGGITALTHALAVSLAGKVRVNSISPGWIDTNDSEFSELSDEDKRQHPAGRVGKPIDVAKAVLYLCSEEAGFITGENINIDGGMTKQMIYHNDNGWKLGML